MADTLKRSLKNIKSLKNAEKLIFLLSLITGSLVLAFLVAKYGIVVGAAFVVGGIGLGLILRSLIDVQFGIYTIYGLSFIIMGIQRVIDFGDFPVAIVVEVFVLVVIVGIVIQTKNIKGFKFKYNLLNILLIFWIVYHILQLGNPNAVSRIAWFYAVRNTFLIVVVYFVLNYAINSEKFVANILKLWIFFMLLAAIYGIKQQYLGFFQFEYDWIYADAQRLGLLQTWGRIRRFSFFDGPATFGVLLAYTGVLCFILMNGPFKNRNKIFLGISGSIMIWAMMFTGTRTASALLPVGLIFYALLTFKKKVLIGVGLFIFIGAVLVFMPTSNPNLYIMRTAFRGGDDASMNVRLSNQELIQPYIQSHPIGAGVGSTGGWGAIFSPQTFIGSFPPDSEYLRVAIELGWIGLLYFCILLFVILKVGIDNYFKTKDLRIKTYYIGILTVTFMSVVAMYPQEAIRVPPTGVLFALCAALLTKMVTIQKQ